MTPDNQPYSPPFDLPQEFSHVELYEAFALTSYGQTLAGNVRYHNFQPEHVSNEEWVELLGEDVDNLRHLSLTMRQTEEFVETCNHWSVTRPGQVDTLALFEPEEARLLLITAAMHDWGEAIKGDVTFHDKQEQDEIEEAEAFRLIVSQLLPEDKYPGFNTETATHVLEILDPKNREGNKLGQAFNAIERVGYMKTALRAYELSFEEKLDPVVRAHMAVLTRDVFANQVETLVEYAKVYPAVDLFLKEEARRISEAFGILSPVMKLRGVTNPAEVEKLFAAGSARFTEAYA